jgi:WD40 repeat protein
VHGDRGPANYQGAVTVWDVAKNKQKWPPIKPKLTYLITCGFSGNGRLLVCSGSGGTEVFDTLTTQLQPAPRGDLVRSVALNGDGRLLALATLQSQTVLLWDHALHREVAALRLPDPAREVVLSADGQTLVALLDQTIQIWRLSGSGEKRGLPGHTLGVTFLAFSPDGKRVASTSHDHLVRVTDVADARVVKELSLVEGAQAAAWSPNGRYLVASTMTGKDLRVWDTDTWQPYPVPDHDLQGVIYSVTFSPDGKYFAASGEGGVTVWQFDQNAQKAETETPIVLRRVARFEEKVAGSLCFSPDGTMLAWDYFGGAAHISEENKVRLVEVGTWSPRRLDIRTLYGLQAVSFSPDGKQLITVSPRNEIEHWDLAAAKRVTIYGASELQEGAVLSTKTALTADGKYLAVGNKFVTVWDTAKQKLLLRLPAEHSPVWSLAWSPNGNELAIGSSDGSAAVWHIPRIREQLAQIGLDW